MKTPSIIQNAHLESTCATVTETEWNKLYHKATRANKRRIHKLVKKHLPELFTELALNLRNPYEYFKTATHLIIVHSATDYFIKYEARNTI
jgi:hypothetical protein